MGGGRLIGLGIDSMTVDPFSLVEGGGWGTGNGQGWVDGEWGMGDGQGWEED